jgi:predicted RecA/RadA family phage recombinase
MKNFIQPGESLTIPAPANVLSGAGVRSGVLFGVAGHDALSGQPVVIDTIGVFELPKVSAQAWTVGQAIFWTAGNQATNVSATGHLFIGVAAAAAVNPSAVGLVRLNPSAPVAAQA